MNQQPHHSNDSFLWSRRNTNSIKPLSNSAFAKGKPKNGKRFFLDSFLHIISGKREPMCPYTPAHAPGICVHVCVCIYIDVWIYCATVIKRKWNAHEDAVCQTSKNIRMMIELASKAFNNMFRYNIHCNFKSNKLSRCGNPSNWILPLYLSSTIVVVVAINDEASVRK